MPSASTYRRAWRRSKHPLGQPTRGKTTQNRLRRVDTFFMLYDGSLLRQTDGPFANAYFVDLGFGAEPITTLESARYFRRVNAALPVLGVEIDPARVAAALPYADELTRFRRGGFDLPLEMTREGRQERARAIRAFNVLRQYDEAAVNTAYAELAYHALPGALLVEGTSDPLGRAWVANVLRRDPTAPVWQAEALVFSTNFRADIEPASFQPVLPKNYIHRMRPGEPIYALMEAWKAAARRTLPALVLSRRHWFAAGARALATAGFRVDTRRRWLRRGFLLVYHPFAVPDGERAFPYA